MTRVSAVASNRAPKVGLQYLERSEPAPRSRCFICGQRTVMVPHHVVGPCCHGLNGPCSRLTGGRYCRFEQKASA